MTAPLAHTAREGTPKMSKPNATTEVRCVITSPLDGFMETNQRPCPACGGSGFVLVGGLDGRAVTCERCDGARVVDAQPEA